MSRRDRIGVVDSESSFLDEERAAERSEWRRLLIRWTLSFGLLFVAVFMAFWWSGSAVRFGASRVTGATTPTYRIWGVVVNSRTGEPVPWARLSDDPSGNPPFFNSEAGQDGSFSLLTLAEPHKVQISAIGYKSKTLSVGRHWFVWWPRGSERRRIELMPE